MKIRTDNKYPLCTIIFTAAILFLILLNACSEKQPGKPDPEKIIPEKTLISILTDAYLTDGLLSIEQVRDKYPEKDSVAAYIDIITKHGYTKEEMDLTLEYYFVRKPKRLIKIYDQITGVLTEMDMRLSNIPADNSSPDNNEWNGQLLYTFPDPEGEGNPDFSFEVNGQEFYTLTFTVTIYPFDQTSNPGFTAWLCSADSIETGKKYYLPPIKYIKDGQLHRYIVTGQNKKNVPVIFKGNLYDKENNPDYGERYGRIENIEFFSSGGR